jgi:hypothetical protein
MTSLDSGQSCQPYAGIGSRTAPADMLGLAEMVAERLEEKGWTLRTGHAPGMDQAFERGAGRRAEVFLPWPTFERSEPLEADTIVDRPRAEAHGVAKRFHPAWERLGRSVRELHARNAHQILGLELNDPVRFVLYWQREPGKGGTETALRIARSYSVPCFDLADPAHVARIEEGLLVIG